MKQQSLFTGTKEQVSYKTVHGGTKTLGKRKSARPLSSKHVIHLVLKSKKAQGQLSMYRFKDQIEEIISKYAKKNFVEIKDLVNMGNHLHIKLKLKSRRHFQSFLRTITALIARAVTKAKKGKSFGKFWDALAFTRVLKTKYEELQLRGYFKANRVESKRGYQARTDFLSQFNEWVYRLKKMQARNA